MHVTQSLHLTVNFVGPSELAFEQRETQGNASGIDLEQKIAGEAEGERVRKKCIPKAILSI